MATTSYEAWRAAADQRMQAKHGIALDDLPDCCYRDWYNDGVSVASAVKKAVSNAGGDF
ncbi:MAG TPA: hypothetical protein VM098_04645 [Phycisphaerae bacterium]|nr:hypothetical protein [Phycisphaerae bacterium]